MKRLYFELGIFFVINLYVLYVMFCLKIYFCWFLKKILLRCLLSSFLKVYVNLKIYVWVLDYMLYKYK